MILRQQVLRESKGRRWVEEAAQTSIGVTEGRDYPCLVNGCIWLDLFIIVLPVSQWGVFSLLSGLVQVFYLRNTDSLIPLYPPPAAFPCVHTPSLHGLFCCHRLQTLQCTTESPVVRPCSGASFGKGTSQGKKKMKSHHPFCGYISPAECQCHKTARRWLRMKSRSQ